MTLDMFKFENNPSVDTDGYLFGGEPIRGYTSVAWREVYREAGEFTLVAPMSSDLITQLPLGSYISHSGTAEVCIVEDHHIKEERNKEPIVTVTGRSLESFYENRVLDQWRDYDGASTGIIVVGQEYAVTNRQSWDAARHLIAKHMLSANAADDDDAVDGWYPSMEANETQPKSPDWGTTEDWEWKQATLYDAVMDTLEVDDFGIRVCRPIVGGTLVNGTPYGTGTQTAIVVHNGSDRRADVIFSWQAGDLQSAEYLWSTRPRRTSAMVIGKWYGYHRKDTRKGTRRRTMLVDGSNVDQKYGTTPTPTSTQGNKMSRIGRRAIRRNNRHLNLIHAEVAENSQFRYREHYDIGDVVMVEGKYNEFAPMRVSEFTEVQDETGYSAQPTLVQLDLEVDD